MPVVDDKARLECMRLYAVLPSLGVQYTLILHRMRK